MNFEADLERIIRQQLRNAGIRFSNGMNLSSLIARHFEMVVRRIIPEPREVHFSEEIHSSLADLANERKADCIDSAHETRQAVFRLRYLITEGRNVAVYLSKSIDSLTSTDGLLWDFGLHHFHLSAESEAGRFVRRSDYLLFAVITPTDAYFVDVRVHPSGRDTGWVGQDLLGIAHSNWRELVEKHVYPGVEGSVLTDEQVKELRRKNVNHVSKLGGKAVGPAGGGTMADGSSILYRVAADRLLHEIKHHQHYFGSQPLELRTQLEARGVAVGERMDFELVLTDGLELSDEIIATITHPMCISRVLYRMGLMIVEATSRLPVAVLAEE